MAQSRTISGDELRARIEKLGLTYTAAAPLLGLTLDGLRKQMGGLRPVSRQTALLLGYLEEKARDGRPRPQAELPLDRPARRRRAATAR